MNPGRPLAALALLFTALCAFGQSYPKGPVRMIVPFPAGGGVADRSSPRVPASRS